MEKDLPVATRTYASFKEVVCEDLPLIDLEQEWGELLAPQQDGDEIALLHSKLEGKAKSMFLQTAYAAYTEKGRQYCHLLVNTSFSRKYWSVIDKFSSSVLDVYVVDIDILAVQVDMEVGDDDTNDGEALAETEKSVVQVYPTLDKVVTFCYSGLEEFLFHMTMYPMYSELHPDKMSASKRQFTSAISSCAYFA